MRIPWAPNGCLYKLEGPLWVSLYLEPYCLGFILVSLIVGNSQTAQRRSCFYTLGPKVGIVFILGAPKNMQDSIDPAFRDLDVHVVSSERHVGAGELCTSRFTSSSNTAYCSGDEESAGCPSTFVSFIWSGGLAGMRTLYGRS